MTATAPSLPRLASGIAGLDTILRGGFLRGSITIVQGKPGVGKTILGNQLCFRHAAAGGRALYVTLLAEDHTRMLMHMAQLAFYDASAIPDGVYYVSAFPVLEAEGLPGLLALLRREIRARDSSLLVLDGLVSAERRASSGMEFKKFIHELQSQATLADCTMFLLTSSARGRDTVTAEHTMVDCVVRMRDRQLDWRTERDLEIRKRRGDGFLGGRHALRITGEGIEVFPRLESLYAVPRPAQIGGPRASTGITGLDRLLHGGLPSGSTTVVLGPPGAGKTTLGLQFLGADPSHPAVHLTLFESPSALAFKTRSLALPAAAMQEEGRIATLWQPTTEGLLDQVAIRLLGAVREQGAKRVFVDGLGGLMKLTDDIRRLPHLFTALAHELRALGVTSLFTLETEDLFASDGALPVSGLSPASVSAIADNLIALRLIEQGAGLVRTVSVLKLRDSGMDTRLHSFEVAHGGLHVAATPAEAERALAAAPTVSFRALRGRAPAPRHEEG